MNLYRRYSLVIGLFVLIVIIVILLSKPGAIFTRGVSFINTDLYRSSRNELYVETNIDFGDNEFIQTLPLSIEGWQGYDYDSSSIEEYLGADVMLMRGYYHANTYQPVFFLIMQSKAGSSFHPPPVCYQAQGYKIEEEKTTEFTVSAQGWKEGELKDDTLTNISIPVKKLVVYKESDGNIIERRVVLYYYVESSKFTSDTITMIRISALAPNDGSYEDVLEIEKDFAAQIFPYMFDPSEDNDAGSLLSQLTGAGPFGLLAIIALFAFPLAIMIYPKIRRE